MLFLLSMAPPLALSRDGFTARWCGLRVNGSAIGSFKGWIYCPLARAAGQWGFPVF